MKRKRIVLFLVFTLVVAGGVAAYFVKRVIHGQADITGPVGVIPKEAAVRAAPERGQADWPCWRGFRGDGKSAVTGIRKDWSGDLKKLWEVDYLCQDGTSATWSAPVVQGNMLVVPGRSKREDLIF